MSANINLNVLKNFIIEKVGGNKLEKKDANKFDISNNTFTKGDVDVNNYLDLDEILNDDDLYGQFTALYKEETDKANAKDNEEEDLIQATAGQGGAKA